MANQVSGKGNPAHKRMSNDKLKQRRAASHVRGEQRKGRNETLNRTRERLNLSKEMTEWELSQVLRMERRKPLEEAWEAFNAAGKTGWKTSEERYRAKLLERRIKQAQKQEQEQPTER